MNSAERQIMALADRPSHRLRPSHERAAWSLAALEAGRLVDAEMNAREIPETPVEHFAWKAICQAEIALFRRQSEEARRLLLAAVGALTLAEQTPETLRLSGAIFEKLGIVERRRENFAAARRCHDAAWERRLRYGSAWETCETAMSLAVDAELSGDLAMAREWLMASAEASSLGGDAQEWLVQVDQRQAELSLREGKPGQALAQAGAARDRLELAAPGGLPRLAAEALLLRCRIAQIQEAGPAGLSGDAPDWNDLFLRAESIQRESLAFGSKGESLAKQCEELLDFVARFRETSP